VDRCSIHDRRRLLEDYVLASKPVVIPDASEAWPARQRWTLNSSSANTVMSRLKPCGRDWTIAEYIAQMRVDQLAPPLPYPFNFDMLERFPELIADVQPQPLFGASTG
jgi:hypothetical protein